MKSFGNVSYITPLLSQVHFNDNPNIIFCDFISHNHSLQNSCLLDEKMGSRKFILHGFSLCDYHLESIEKLTALHELWERENVQERKIRDDGRDM